MRNQKIIKGETGEESSAMIVKSLVTHPVVLFLVNDLPVLSFLVANCVIFYIINFFWKLDLIYSILIFIIGVLLSLAIIKPSYFLDLDGLRKRVEMLKNTLRGSESHLLLKISPSELFSFSLRNLFFNMLNDSFVLLIFWLTIYGGTILLNLTILPGDNEFRLFSETMVLIGIISGLFQFYVKEYKTRNMKIINSLIEKRLSEAKNVSFLDFRKFLKDKNLTSLESKIDEIIKGKYVQTPGGILPCIIKKERSEFPIYNIYNQISRPIGLNDNQLFIYLESYAEGHPDLNKNDLVKQYRDYFSAKRQDINKAGRKQKTKELRKLMFTAIFFSDEIIYSHLNALTSLPESKDRPDCFIDIFNNFANNCAFDLFKQVVTYEPERSINDYFKKISNFHDKHQKNLSIISGIICLFVVIYFVSQIFK